MAYVAYVEAHIFCRACHIYKFHLNFREWNITQFFDRQKIKYNRYKKSFYLFHFYISDSPVGHGHVSNDGSKSIFLDDPLNRASNRLHGNSNILTIPFHCNRDRSFLPFLDSDDIVLYSLYSEPEQVEIHL